MGRYDSHKHPFQYKMNQWGQKRINDRLEREAKSIPCHVTKVDKDFIEVQFETQNGIFTPPTVKIPQSWSQYSREPTQVGDKGYAVPGNYYLGGVTGDAGGSTDYYPRGNLTTLSFNGVSHKQNPDRDYDQLTHMGGPNGWIVGPYQQQQQDGQNGQNGNGSSSTQVAMLSMRRSTYFRNEQAKYVGNPRAGIPAVQVTTTSSSSTSSTSQQQQQQDLTQFSFDKNGKALVQSKDGSHNLVVDQQNKTIGLNSAQIAYVNPGNGQAYVGGQPNSGTYAKIMTQSGPSMNSYARVS